MWTCEWYSGKHLSSRNKNSRWAKKSLCRPSRQFHRNDKTQIIIIIIIIVMNAEGIIVSNDKTGKISNSFEHNQQVYIHSPCDLWIDKNSNFNNLHTNLHSKRRMKVAQRRCVLRLPLSEAGSFQSLGIHSFFLSFDVFMFKLWCFLPEQIPVPVLLMRWIQPNGTYLTRTIQQKATTKKHRTQAIVYEKKCLWTTNVKKTIIVMKNSERKEYAIPATIEKCCKTLFLE